MAFSKSQTQATAQHYLVCATEHCEKHCQFYCIHCHLQMCEQCRDEHKKSPNTVNHDVVSYRQRQHQFPLKQCEAHPTKEVDMICDDCKVPVCSKCATQEEHRKHSFNDLEVIYSKGFTFCLNEIKKIKQYFLPTSRDIQEDIMKNTKEIKAAMDKIRKSMKDKAESVIKLVDTVLSDTIDQVNKMEESLVKELECQDKTYQDYISYLEDLDKEFHGYLSSTLLHNNPIIFSFSDHLKIQPIPETTKPVPPVFTAGQYSKEDVSKLLGRVTVPDIKPVNRKIKPMIASITSNHTEKQMKPNREISDTKPALSLSFSVTKVREYTVPGVNDVHHISLGKSGRVWGSDRRGNIVQTDLQGNQLQKIQTSGGFAGYHTVTQDGDLIFADRNNKAINIITLDKTTIEFIQTEFWEPISLHSSHINGDILVGMIMAGEGQVTRYNKTGKKMENIRRDNKGRKLFSDPCYITENINGDICTSDHDKKALVVVDKSGQYRFSYTGDGSKFLPRGICTDLFGHIIVCNANVENRTVDILDQEGRFMYFLLTKKQGLGYPGSLCVDDENHLHLGQGNTNTVTVYKYL